MIIIRTNELHYFPSSSGFLMQYIFNVLSLLIYRKITFLTAVYAIKSRPIVVAGRRGGYVVDPDFE